MEKGNKLSLNVKSIFDRMAKSNLLKKESKTIDKRIHSSFGRKSSHSNSDKKTIFSKRKGSATSRYNPDYSPQKISQINYGENFTKMLKETIIKDIQSDVFREMAQAEGGVPKAMRNSYLPSNFRSTTKAIPLTKKINNKIDLHIQKHHLVLEK
mmetsp:Transcript_13333/g.13265  ORF Transcript_13333/g.13265 Transcript_13333/m.13265 type:complete len:154 (+) Transcript_13333:225-686(+)|eukprot:CAMPEP_0197018830 /NCGR_PEP_ID=MMETSP1380-20130617/80330_1 /TAXON_ID=5936 /ORGANISM="Euplotes crassus, Strain CT5" /LENGTH=153 /DNA_ID=CAMNT_0042446113 /DNA_START=641 /DNA_END=1102 /DNA_ORIENTATION=+